MPVITGNNAFAFGRCFDPHFAGELAAFTQVPHLVMTAGHGRGVKTRNGGELGKPGKGKCSHDGRGKGMRKRGKMGQW